MKRVYLLLFCGFIAISVKAQSKSEKQVAASVETLKQAMLDGNRTALEDIASNELSYGHSSGKIEDKASFVESIASGKSDFVTLDLTEQSIKVSGKTALVRHKLSAKTNDNGNPGNVNLGVLLVFQKQKGDWRLLARQAFKL
ncbi:nuclear transport factor 2 family protein [Pedobacter sp. P351]|uniref:nuclear transport factor 2 family protein n=1 Tax=Pedobacter superstes TaxID=3133441 RepID=UPI0030B13126